MKKFELKFICERFSLDEEIITRWMSTDLLSPADPAGPLFDEEDLARIRLIIEIQETYSSNDESIELILHLIDQIHALSAEVRGLKES